MIRMQRTAPALFAALMLAAPALAQNAPPVPPGKPAEAQTPTPPQPPAQAPGPANTPPAAPPPPGEAATPDAEMDLVAACKAEALGKLKQKSPEIDDIFIDVDGLTVAEADGRLGDTAVKGVLMGEAYIQRDRSDRVHRFLCLTGDKGQVLFTFFTER